MVNRLYGQFVRTICLICTVRPPCYLLPQLEVLLEALHGHLHHGAPVILEGLQGRLPRVLPGVHVAANGVLAISLHRITSDNYENSVIPLYLCANY